MFAFCVAAEESDNDPIMQEWAYLSMNFGLKLWVRGNHKLKVAQGGPMPDLPIVLAAPENVRPGVITGDQSLVDFEHPEECIYWFGGIDELVTDEPAGTVARVFIPMEEMLLSPSAGAIFLWDRVMKRGEPDNR